MATRSLIGLILSIGMVVAMWWGCSFDVQQVIGGPFAKAYGGKFQYLTILNMVNEEKSNRFFIEVLIFILVFSIILLRNLHFQFLPWL